MSTVLHTDVYDVFDIRQARSNQWLLTQYGKPGKNILASDRLLDDVLQVLPHQGVIADFFQKQITVIEDAGQGAVYLMGKARGKSPDGPQLFGLEHSKPGLLCFLSRILDFRNVLKGLKPAQHAARGIGDDGGVDHDGDFFTIAIFKCSPDPGHAHGFFHGLLEKTVRGAALCRTQQLGTLHPSHHLISPIP